MSLVLWRGERQITSVATPYYCPLSPNSQTSAFLIYSCYTFKNFLLEVVAIGRKNAGWESNKDKNIEVQQSLHKIWKIKVKLIKNYFVRGEFWRKQIFWEGLLMFLYVLLSTVLLWKLVQVICSLYKKSRLMKDN